MQGPLLLRQSLSFQGFFWSDGACKMGWDSQASPPAPPRPVAGPVPGTWGRWHVGPSASLSTRRQGRAEGLSRTPALGRDRRLPRPRGRRAGRSLLGAPGRPWVA